MLRLGHAVLAALALCCLLPAAARAEREHVVVRGQTLAAIAKRYGVTAQALAAANRRERSSMLREGQILRVPARGELYVASGDTIAGIARRFDVSVEQLARINRLRSTAQLQIGQKLVLPGFEAATKQVEAEKRWGRPKHPGVATLRRIHDDETRRVRLVDTRGRVKRNALDQLKRLFRPKDSRKRKEPHPRLVRLLAQISDHFGGRRIELVSGYRLAGGNTRESSRHVAGQAIDFRIPGVPLQVLRDYCASFDNVGVGLYPRTKFVHLDVRRDDARWTDYAGRGEKAVLRDPRQTAAEVAEIVEGAAEADGEAPLDDGSQELSDEAE